MVPGGLPPLPKCTIHPCRDKARLAGGQKHVGEDEEQRTEADHTSTGRGDGQRYWRCQISRVLSPVAKRPKKCFRRGHQGRTKSEAQNRGASAL